MVAAEVSLVLASLDTRGELCRRTVTLVDLLACADKWTGGRHPDEIVTKIRIPLTEGPLEHCMGFKQGIRRENSHGVVAAGFRVAIPGLTLISTRTLTLTLILTLTLTLTLILTLTQTLIGRVLGRALRAGGSPFQGHSGRRGPQERQPHADRDSGIPLFLPMDAGAR